MLARRQWANFSTSLVVAAGTTLHVSMVNSCSSASSTVSSNGSSLLQPVFSRGIADLRSTDDEARRNNDIPRLTVKALALNFPRFDLCFNSEIIPIFASGRVLGLEEPFGRSRQTRVPYAQTYGSQSTIRCHETLWKD
jgi:hypothetical protein